MRFDLDRLGPVAAVGGKAWAGPELAAEARRRAGVLAGFGLGRGQTALIAHGGTPAFFADLFAVWQAGACAACVNPELTPPELANLVAFTKPAVVLAADGFKGGDPGVRVIDLGRETAAAEPPAAPESALDDPALILFTSGTTGNPKGVVHSFRSLAARIALNRAHIGAALARTLCVLPTHFGHGLIGNCLTALLGGDALYVVPKAGVREMGRLGDILAADHITFMSSVPSFWKVALKAGKPPSRRTLARVQIGSAPLAAGLWRQVMDWTGTDDVVNMYGITETCNWIGGASARDFAPEDGLIGRLWGGSALLGLPDGRAVAAGEGEILVQTPSLMTGYLGRPDLTAQVLRAGWFHTGDIGTLDAAGVLRLTGRQKHEINRGGIKVHPEEIDLLLERHAAVAEACTFGIPDDISGEIVGIAVRLADGGAAVAADDLRAWCRERLKRESVPERWFVVPEIPKTDRGKINRDRVRDYCLAKGAV